MQHERCINSIHMRATAAFLKGVIALTFAGCALAATAAASESPSRAPLADEGPAFVFDAIEQLSEADLKEFYLRCARESVRGRLGHGEIALCSVGYERLLNGTFRGDIRALLEWRRGLGRSRHDAPATDPR
jgi:hypothetical protein